MSVGIIDLGSNTFHLLVAKKAADGFEVQHKERQFVHLSERGVHHLEEDIIDRAYKTLAHFVEVCQNYSTCTIYAFGTETLRKADNADDFHRLIKEGIGLDIQIIDGQREAELIAKGVQTIAGNHADNSIIVDIGGGSVEFIISKNGQVITSLSFPIGSTVLFNRFHRSDPIHADEIEAINTFLDGELEPLVDILDKHPVSRLIGCSGSFEVLGALHRCPDQHFYRLDLNHARTFMDQVIPMTLQQRENHPNLPSWRAKLMPVAFILCQWVIDRLNIDSFFFSNYSLKEGILTELLD